jgi:hypothetical protein
VEKLVMSGSFARDAVDGGPGVVLGISVILPLVIVKHDDPTYLAKREARDGVLVHIFCLVRAVDIDEVEAASCELREHAAGPSPVNGHFTPVGLHIRLEDAEQVLHLKGSFVLQASFEGVDALDPRRLVVEDLFQQPES